jgi:hypothetical protein
VHLLDLDWTAQVGNIGQQRQPPRAIGPRSQAVIDELLARASGIEPGDTL